MRCIAQSGNQNSEIFEQDQFLASNRGALPRGYTARVSIPMSAQALVEGEVTRLTLLARGVVQSLGLFLRAQPQQTVRGLAVSLKVDQSLVQRTLAGLGDGATQDPLGALVKLPPVASLRKLLVARRGATVESKQERASALAAVSALEQAVRELGGPRRFKLRLGQAIKRQHQEARELEAVAQSGATDPNGLIHRAAAEIAGSDCRAKFRINIIWPDRTAPGRYHNVLAGGAIGTRLRSGGMPMYGFTDFGGATGDETGMKLGPTLTRVQEWSTPALTTSTRQTPDGGSVVVVDDHRAAGPDGVNLTLANITQFEPGTGRLFIALISPILTPSHRFVADVYLDRSLSLGLVPRAGVFIHTPALAADPCSAWRTQLPQRVTVEALGPGMSRAGSDAWDGHGELARELAQRAGVDAGQLVGYRIDVANPIWGMAYCLWLDFADRLV